MGAANHQIRIKGRVSDALVSAFEALAVARRQPGVERDAFAAVGRYEITRGR